MPATSLLLRQLKVVGIAMAVLTTLKLLQDRFGMGNTMTILAFRNEAVLFRMAEYTPQFRMRLSSHLKQPDLLLVALCADIIGHIHSQGNILRHVGWMALHTPLIVDIFGMRRAMTFCALGDIAMPFTVTCIARQP